MVEELLTPSELERKRKHQNICRRFLILRQEYPEAKPYRLFWKLAMEFDMTQQGIKVILERNKMLKPQAQS